MTGTELVRDFVNTRELLDPIEQFGSPEELGAWLSSNGIASKDVRPDADDLRARGRATRGAAPDPALEHRGRGRHRGRVLGARRRPQRGRGSSLHFSGHESDLLPARRGDGRRARADRDRRARGDGRRLVEPAQGVPGLGLRVGVHRHREEPLAGSGARWGRAATARRRAPSASATGTDRRSSLSLPGRARGSGSPAIGLSRYGSISRKPSLR